jgi:uncharacterized protein YjiS (DUF1127 family)
MTMPSQTQRSLEFDFRTYRPWRRSLIRSIKRWIAWQVENRRIRRDIQHLLEMDDRLLDDVGLTRHEVKTAARSPRPLEARSASHQSHAYAGTKSRFDRSPLFLYVAARMGLKD